MKDDTKLDFEVWFGDELYSYVWYDLKRGIFIDDLVEQVAHIREDYKGKKLWLKLVDNKEKK
jgi:hypothetical protein